MKTNKQLPFWIFSLSVVFGLTLPVLIQDAMFQDAMLYSSVSHNLSQGIGTFWFPQYSKMNIAGLSSFHEHPPLLFGIQALFFKVLGSSIYVERFYTLLMIVFNILLIHMLWKEIFSKSDGQRKLGWLPVLFWMTIPVCFWSFRGNMMENTMSVFDLAAVLLFFYAIKSRRNEIFLLAGSGLMIFLASFTKGIPGLFPLAVPFLYWLTLRKTGFWQSVWQTAILFAVAATIYVVLFLFPESSESLSNYVFKRLLMRVDVMPTADYRLEILWRLVKELIPVMIMVSVVSAVAFFKKMKTGFSNHSSNILVFLLIGFSGSAPLATTMVQKGWYLVPAFPYFAIGFALMISPMVAVWIEKINSQKQAFRIFTFLTILMMAGVIVITASQYGKVSRERETVADVYEIGKVVPRLSAITVPQEMYSEYNFILEGFLVRYFNISLDPREENEYFMKLKTLNADVPEGYKRVQISLNKYDLFKKQ
ncbi:MAG: glycosyltransferase family 39 protein [Bacteroidales bacterium]|nr:glycosyltransferase family 39 protein [Bacteroidales bacterium]